MNLINFSTQQPTSYKMAILIKSSSFNRQNLEQYYVTPLELKGVDPADIMAVDLPYNSSNKAPVKKTKENLATVLPLLDKLGVQFILCADSAHYKQLTSFAKPESNIDNIVACTVKGYEHIQVGYTVNYASLLYNPDQTTKITTSLNTMAIALQGSGPIKRIELPFTEERYPHTLKQIQEELDYLLTFDELVVDIEAFGLRLGEAGIASISFAESATSGCAFLVDYYPIEEENGYYGMRRDNFEIRKMLKQFFVDYKGNLTAHNCSYDFKQLIWELFMRDPLDKVGMLDGLFILTKNFDDTRIMAYCANNSTSKPSQALKQLTYEYAGDYAQDEIKDVRKIQPFDLLRYNLTDSCATFWYKQKALIKMEQDDQIEFYEEQCLPMQRVLLQAELHGMPMDDDQLNSVTLEMEEAKEDFAYNVLKTRQAVEALKILRRRTAAKKNATYKKKTVTENDFLDIKLNLNSGQQLEVLLYEVMKLPVIKTTPTGMPKSDTKTLKALLAHARNEAEISILNHLIEYNSVKKICSDFLPNFAKGILKADGRRYLHGNFNIGGTVSGRLSSSSPNLQNLPAGSTHGKKIKSIFCPPENHLWVYSDFNSLEDYISALLSKDPNKLKVYLEGYDGHCLRAFSYFRDQLPGIVDTVDSINSIKKKFPDVRQDSKAPTFLLTYLGTYMGLMENCGFSEEAAKNIEKMYHELYAVSDQYTEKRLKEAAQQGYTTLAFGLRLRCPMLKKSADSKSRYALRGVRGEERTLGNAFGQSYGLLNSRAMVDFMERVWASPYKYSIMPIAPIHDASYYICEDDVKVVKFINDNLIDAMQWQEDPAIKHEKVKIGGELDVCYGSWAVPITIPNNATEEQILDICDKFVEEYNTAKAEEVSEDDMDADERHEILEEEEVE